MAIHPTADVSPHAKIGEKTQVWHQAQIREGACLGQGPRLPAPEDLKKEKESSAQDAGQSSLNKARTSESI